MSAYPSLAKFRWRSHGPQAYIPSVWKPSGLLAAVVLLATAALSLGQEYRYYCINPELDTRAAIALERIERQQRHAAAMAERTAFESWVTQQGAETQRSVQFGIQQYQRMLDRERGNR